MAEETKILDGVLEDATGAQLMPATKAGQVVHADGQTAEQKAAALAAALTAAKDYAAANYLDKTVGGRVNGPVSIHDWTTISTGSGGVSMLAENAYIDYATNQFRYVNTHASLGARGFIFNLQGGIMWFDTGSIATTKDAAFTPGVQPLKPSTAELFTGDMNSLTKTGWYNGNAMANAPGAGWYYVEVMSHTHDRTKYAVQIAYNFEGTAAYLRTLNGTWSAWKQFLFSTGGTVAALDVSGNAAPLRLIGTDHIYLPIYKGGLAGGRSAYLGYESAGRAEFTINNEVPNGTVHVKAAQGLWLNGMKVPNIWQSTQPPTASQGADGDVWHQYV